MKSKIFNLVIISLFAFSLVGVGLVSAHGDESDELYGDHHDGMMGNSFWEYGMFGGVGFMWIFMILIIITLVLLIIWLIKQIQKPERRK